MTRAHAARPTVASSRSRGMRAGTSGTTCSSSIRTDPAFKGLPTASLFTQPNHDRGLRGRPDGRTVVVSGSPAGNDEILRHERRWLGSAQPHAHRGSTRTRRSWSPTGAGIVFASGSKFRRARTIHTIRPDGRRHRNLGQGTQPNWRADGRSIVFIRASGAQSDIYVMTASGRNPNELHRTVAWYVERLPAGHRDSSSSRASIRCFVAIFGSSPAPPRRTAQHPRDGRTFDCVSERRMARQPLRRPWESRFPRTSDLRVHNRAHATRRRCARLASRDRDGVDDFAGIATPATVFADGHETTEDAHQARTVDRATSDQLSILRSGAGARTRQWPRIRHPGWVLLPRPAAQASKRKLMGIGIGLIANKPARPGFGITFFWVPPSTHAALVAIDDSKIQVPARRVAASGSVTVAKSLNSESFRLYGRTESGLTGDRVTGTWTCG